MTPPSGQDSLQVRRAYFRARRSRHFGSWGFTAVCVSVGAVFSWVVLAGVTGLVH